jgi:hypothetical protein
VNRSLYVLKQAGLEQPFATHLVTLGFIEAMSDASLFVYHRGADTVYLLLYVDDIVLTASYRPFFGVLLKLCNSSSL